MRRLPWSLGAFGVVLCACCAAEATGNSGWFDVAAVLFTLGFALGGRGWLTRASGKFGVSLAGAVLVIALALGVSPAAVLAPATRMSGVVALMLSIALVRPIFAQRRLDEALAALLARVPPLLRRPAVLLAACTGSLGLSFGAVGILGASLGRRTAPEHIAPCAAMRGLVLSMLIGPSTASVAAVMALHPDVGWGAALSVGLPLAAVGMLLGSSARQPLAVDADAGRSGGWTALVILAAELAIAVFVHLVLGLSMTLAISVASAAIAVTCTLYWGHNDVGGALRRAERTMRETWCLLMPEAALFLASGLVVGLMQSPAVSHAVGLAADSALPSGMYGIATILIVVPLITVAGIHPIILFALLAPTVSSVMLGINELGLYTMWVVAFMLSMLLSPASVLTMVTVTNFGIPGRLLGLRGHGLYALALAATTAVAITVFCHR